MGDIEGAKRAVYTLLSASDAALAEAITGPDADALISRLSAALDRRAPASAENLIRAHRELRAARENHAANFDASHDEFGAALARLLAAEDEFKRLTES